MQTLTRVTDRVMVEANEAFLKTLGYSRAEVIGKAALELSFWVFPEKAGSFREQLATQGFVRDYEVQIRTKTGAVCEVLLSAEMVEIDGIPHVVAAGVEVTERQRTQEELRLIHERLRLSEERFSKAFRANPAIVVITRFTDGTFVSVNEAFQRTTGYSEKEVIGRTANDIQLHATLQQREEFLKRIDQQGFMRDHELVIRTKDGHLRTLLASGEQTIIDGAPHLLTVGLDITERKEAEAHLRESELRLRESEERFGTAFRASPVFMTIGTLPDGRFIEVNDAFTQELGLTRAEALGRNSLELNLWASAEDRDRLYAQVRQNGTARNVECRIRRRDGIVRTMLISAEQVEINRVPHMLTFGVDITERKEAESEQKLALQKERELNQLKTDFVALVSHEFRTPLEIIMSSVDNLDRYHERLSPEKRAELLRTINKSVRRMSGMMEDVLLLGRFDDEGTKFQPAPLELAVFCGRVRDEMESATTRRCPIRLRIDEPLPGAHGDETVLRHILTNLLSNAVKYSPTGQPVELTIQRAGPDAVIRIIDQGCGIPAADQKRLFQAFYRGSNVRQVPGTGLGLLIVRRCVDLHGGAIELESAEGRGTVWTVRLPLFTP